MFIRLGFRKKVESTKKKSRHLGKCDTPAKLGEKWQLDVKYVPTACYSGLDDEKFFQYTVIEEASRKRFIYPYKEQSECSTVDFVKRAVTFFGYAPKVIQSVTAVSLRISKRLTGGIFSTDSAASLALSIS